MLRWLGDFDRNTPIKGRSADSQSLTNFRYFGFTVFVKGFSYRQLIVVHCFRSTICTDMQIQYTKMVRL